MPVGLVLVIVLMAAIALMTVVSIAILRIAQTTNHACMMRLSQTRRHSAMRSGARLSFIPEIGPPLLVPVTLSLRSAALRSSHGRRRGWKEWPRWNM
jgi:hypothetical protein